MYKTQMEAARKGILTEQMKIVAKKEQMPTDVLMERMAKGEIIIPCNKNHKSLDPEGIGRGLRTKINVNLGVSEDSSDNEGELDKVRRALDMGAESIMDLSNYGKTRNFRKSLMEISTAMIGTVPMYDVLGYHDKELAELEPEDFFKVVKIHAEDGVDFLTIHVGMNRESAEVFSRNERLTNIVSRGGSLTYAWMQARNRENPFFEYYDDLLEICREYDITISLGDALRPGSIHDATDAAQIKELITLGELTKRAWEKDVQVMIEGPGHMALDEIAANVLLQKKLCHGAPFYVLGPLVTDVAPGYDHITSAIGGAVAASHGVDFLCYVTPAEHLRLPNLADVEEGIVACKIAAHAGDLVKRVPGSHEWDYAMSEARANLDWNCMFHHAIHPEKAKAFREQDRPEHEDSCTMCGKMCAVRTMNRVMKGEGVDL